MGSFSVHWYVHIFAAKRSAFLPLARYAFACVRSENTVFKVTSLFFIRRETVNDDAAVAFH